MKKLLSFTFFFASIFSCIYAQDAKIKFAGWKKAETEHFNFIFEEGARSTTEAYAEIADEAWNKIAGIYAIPQNKTNVYVTDRTNTVNAFTYFSPLEIGMFTTPCYISDFGFREEWKKLFFTHELIHVANVNFESRAKWPAKVFGPLVGAMDIQNTLPGWALEGLTTVLETELTNGGRGRSPFFELKYKAPTLDNAFISYNEIGLEQEPPRGQSYVMGYLIMRSIADRFGVQALADIQRNKSYFGSYEEAVFKVTGESAENIYKDVRIALSKKYSAERNIPEGIIITPRTTGASYFRPAVILDDGSIITLRTMPGRDAAVVQYNPSAIPGSNYLEDSVPEKNLNTVLKETILFENSFPDEHSVTADKNGIVYAVLSAERRDRFPGYENETAIFKWTKENGLCQLTRGTSYFWPSVSRDGSVLVALKQIDLNFALVQIDTETGMEKEILYLPGNDIMEPSVNENGSRVVFLKADGKRASVCAVNLTSPENYKVLVNGEGEIIDPVFPVWDGQGNVLYGANTRGRLEVFEYSEEAGNSVPVVADPVGALWAYKTEKGIYYYSYTSNGYALKMKPVSEWAVVPEFDGPSLPGEKICFGSLENDFPDFNPYPGVQERVFVKDNSEKIKKEKADSNSGPVPVAKIELKERDSKFIEQLENLPPAKEVLENEKKYFPLLQPVLYTPVFGFMNSDDTVLGLGYDMAWMNPKLQNSTGFGNIALIYYPEKNNFDFWIINSFMAGPLEIDIMVQRENLQKYEKLADSSEISDLNMETNSLLLGASIPLFNRQQYRNYTGLHFNVVENAVLYRLDKKPLPLFAGPSYDFCLVSKAGISLDVSRLIKKEKTWELSMLANGLLPFVSDDQKFHLGAEGKIDFRMNNKSMGFSVGAKGRYIEMPEDSSVSLTGFEYGGELVDTSEPGRFLLDSNFYIPVGMLPNTSLLAGCEKLWSWTKDRKILTDDFAALKLGCEMRIFPMTMECGITCKADLDQGIDYASTKFYFNFTYGLIQF